MLLALKEKIKANPLWKQLAVRLLTPNNDPRPRWWVRNLLTPIFHHFGSGSKIRRSTRLDLFPYNSFRLGKKSIIESFSVVNNGVGDVMIGDDCIIGLGSVLIGPVAIGHHVMLAQHVVISGLNHEYQDITIPIKSQGITKAPIVIGDNTWIGANSVITAGVTIGKNCVVAGGSVVTRDIPDYTVVAGTPARVLKQYDSKSQSWIKPSSSTL